MTQRDNRLLPLFPLPNVVLFPGCYLPLHIFESRYRQMIQDVIETERKMLVIALLKPGWEKDYHQCPEVYSTGCAARVTAVEKLSDGRYNILAEGVDRIELIDEVRVKTYREAITRVISPDAAQLEPDRRRVITLLSDIITATSSEVPDGFLARIAGIPGVAALTDTVAHILQLPIAEKQRILETMGLEARLDILCTRLEKIRDEIKGA